jgi:hypothetical protein
LHDLKEFSSATALDLKMGYYTIRLDQGMIQNLYIILPWGQYTPTRVNDENGRISRHIPRKLLELMESQEDA